MGAAFTKEVLPIVQITITSNAEAAVPLPADTIEQFTSDMCNYFDLLHQAGVLPDQFRGLSKEEVISALASIYQGGDFESAEKLLADISEMCSIPTPASFLARLWNLQKQWDAALTFQMETSIVDRDSGFITAYRNSPAGTIPHGAIFAGKTDVCRYLLAQLNCGAMAPWEIRSLYKLQQDMDRHLCLEDFGPPSYRNPVHRPRAHREIVR